MSNRDYFSRNGILYRRPDGDGLPPTQDETYHTIRRQHLKNTSHDMMFPVIVPKGTNVYQLINYWNQRDDWKYTVES